MKAPPIPKSPSPSHDPLEILLSQRFIPEQGGSIRWMYEAYRRWPRNVRVITHDYYDYPIRRPEFPDVPVRPPAGDHVTDANLIMDRRDIFISDWGMESLSRLKKYARMTGAVGEQLRAFPSRTVRVHCTHAVPEVVSLIPLRWRYGKRLQIVCYAHGEEVTACCSSRQLKFLMRRAHTIIDLMIANSSYTAKVLQPHIDPRRYEKMVHVINPGVEIEEFTGALEAGRELRTERCWQDKLILLTVGRLDPRKNQAAVIEAVAKLAPKFPNLIYVVAGRGRHEETLKKLAADRGVANRVVFTGPVDGALKIALYGACDLFAMPAIRDGTDVEGFGLVFLEAGACGKPSLAGREGGQAEAVLHDKTGMIVDGTDYAAVSAALDKMLADGDLRRQFGEAGRRHAENFAWPRVVQRTVELVENTM